MNEPEALKLIGIDHSYADVPILRSLDFSLAAGEYCVVLGRSGSGKSTLLRLIAGLIPLEAGTIKMNQQCVARTSPKDRHVAMLFQDDRLYPHWTLRRAMELACRASNVEQDTKTEIESLARRFQIADVLDRRPDQVSGGQLRRAALAKAILRRPAVLLLDEPLHGLDATLREDFLSLLADLPRQRGRTTASTDLPSTAIVHVTHDGDEAMRLADRIAVLDQGRVVQSGPPSEIYHRPQTLAVARSLGHPPVNVLSANAANAFALESTESQWIVRPENLEVVASDTQRSNGIQWQARLIKSRFVNGHWVSHWRSHEQDWRCVSTDDPMRMVVNQSATLSMHPDRMHRVGIESRITND
ncbi:ABC transporter ATP-binding protein [Neorhodopirellula pilleata]|uniref:Trehalose import ATP-binding protein SugC n=1 Tax=Neorhodopirellula pilleata TaxID=2714738 RepID=A0A5C5ZQC9_9BACT|nr:ABC transporter ATP-binding protein [Neorhodopirellula pilleata]TWT89305.1 Trehalose import ATP-binding protein SugC [Neorhodopirellula pilleata]